MYQVKFFWEGDITSGTGVPSREQLEQRMNAWLAEISSRLDGQPSIVQSEGKWLHVTILYKLKD